LSTGSTPGSPQHTGQILLFGPSFHESALQAQKILLWVLKLDMRLQPDHASYSVIVASRR
jgi:hypothetical protein